MGKNTRSKPTARVLIVDDDPQMCWALEKILERESYSIFVTTSAKDALEILPRVPFDLVFLGSKLRHAEGMELCSRMKSIREETHIFLTSSFFSQDDPVIQDLFQKRLIVGFLRKPFDARDVRNQARRAVKQMGLQD